MKGKAPDNKIIISSESGLCSYYAVSCVTSNLLEEFFVNFIGDDGFYSDSMFGNFEIYSSPSIRLPVIK